MRWPLLLIIFVVGIKSEYFVGGPGKDITFYGLDDFVLFDHFDGFGSEEISIQFWMVSFSRDLKFTPFCYVLDDFAFAWNGIVGFRFFGVDVLFFSESEEYVVEVMGEFDAEEFYVWHHYSVTWSNYEGVLMIYRDAVLWIVVDMPSTVDKIIPQGGSLILGQFKFDERANFDSGYSFQGKMDDFRVWDIELTEFQIMSNYQISYLTLGKPVGLVSEWLFENQFIRNITGFYNLLDKQLDAEKTRRYNFVIDLYNRNNGVFQNKNSLMAGIENTKIYFGASSANCVANYLATFFYLTPTSEVVLPLNYASRYTDHSLTISLQSLPLNLGSLFTLNNTELSLLNGFDIGDRLFVRVNSVVFYPNNLPTFFLYRVSEGFESKTGSVIVNINQSPTAESFEHFTFQEIESIIQMRCVDSDGDKLSAVINSLPKNGILYQVELKGTIYVKGEPVKAGAKLIHPSSIVIFSPIFGSADSSFTYQCSDGLSSLSSSETVTIKYWKAPDKPISGGDLFALEFNGNNNYLISGLLPSPKGILLSKSTIEFYLKLYPDIYHSSTFPQKLDTSNSTIFGIYYSEDINYFFSISIEKTDNLNTLYFVNQIPGETITKKFKGTIMEEKWNHLAFIFGTESVTMLLNGIVIENLYTGALLKTRKVILGRKPDTDIGYLHGALNEFRIWNYVMSDSVLDIVAVQKPDLENTDLFSYWDFNEGSGFNVHDLVGNFPFLNVSIQNMPRWIRSDGNHFSNYVTKESEYLVINLFSRSRRYESIVNVIQTMPKGRLFQYNDNTENHLGDEILSSYSSWSGRKSVIVQWADVIQNISSSRYIYDSALVPNLNYWSPFDECDPTGEYIDVSYLTEIYLSQVSIYFRNHAGGVKEIYSYDEQKGKWISLYLSTNPDPLPDNYTLTIPLCEAGFKSTKIRVFFITCTVNGLLEVDAIQVFGTEELRDGVISNRNGKLIYLTPDPLNVLIDTFTYSSIQCPYDGEVSDPVLITVSISPVNKAPISHNQVITMLDVLPHEIFLEGTDPENEFLTFVIVTLPSNGVLYQYIQNTRGKEITAGEIVLSSNNSILYHPTTTRCGLALDNFSFSVTDGFLTSGVSNVTIDIYCNPGSGLNPIWLFISAPMAAIIFILIMLFLLIWIYMQRTARIMRYGSSVMSAIFLIGCILLTSYTFFTYARLTTPICIFRMWIINSGLSLICSVLFAMIYRVWIVYIYEKFGAGEIMEKHFYLSIFCFCVVILAVLIVYTAVNPPYMIMENDINDPSKIRMMCIGDVYFSYILFIVYCSAITVSFLLCFILLITVDNNDNEISTLSLVICVAEGFLIIGFLSNLYIPPQSDIYIGVHSIGILSGVLLIMMIMFIPKIYDIHKKKVMQDFEPNNSNTSKKHTKKNDHELNHVVQEKSDEIEILRRKLLKVKSRSRNLEQRILFCENNH